jgi:hypothetical protein
MDRRGKHHKNRWTEINTWIKEDKGFTVKEMEGEEEKSYSEFEKLVKEVYKFSKDRNENDITEYIKKENEEIVHIEIIDTSDIAVNEIPKLVKTASGSMKSAIEDSIRKLKRTTSFFSTNIEYVGFEEWYDANCQIFDRSATIFYYMGTILMLVNLITYNHAYFYYSYNSLEGATVSTVVISISLLLGTIIICGGIFNKNLNKKT